MLTRVYLVGIAFIAVATVAIRQAGRAGTIAPEPHGATPMAVPAGGNEARAWFASVKPYCNSVEVETALRQSPPPASSGYQSPGYAAACLALAGKVPAARNIIAALPTELQWQAAGIVFEIAHPVADAGDDRSAGPIMAMVVEFWPNHYMALYHAGISEKVLGETDKARNHLKAFLQLYTGDDGWRTSAKAALDEIGQ